MEFFTVWQQGQGERKQKKEWDAFNNKNFYFMLFQLQNSFSYLENISQGHSWTGKPMNKNCL